MSETLGLDACLICGAGLSRSFQRFGWAYFKCVRCGTFSMNPQPDGHQIEAHYERKFDAGNYELLRRFAPFYRPVYEGFLAFVRDSFAKDGRPLRGLKILEVGCFTGEFLLLAHEAGCDVRGFELQQRAVDIADKSLPGKVSKTDVFDGGIEGESYDAVCLFGVVEHVRDPRSLILRCISLLRPGGRIFIQTPDAASVHRRLMGRLWPPFAPVEHINLLSRNALRRCLEEGGCAVETARSHWKTLPVEYIYEMLRNFGPEWRRLLAPLYVLGGARLARMRLPFAVGEVLLCAVRKSP